jgi:hypothetical protein
MEGTPMLKRALVAASAVVLVAGLAAPASAAEKETFQLTCDNGFDGTVVGTGHGQWTPAIAEDGTVFVPIAFGAFSATAYEPGTNNVIDSFSDDSVVAKKAHQNGRDATDCTFSSSAYNVYDEELDMVIDVTFSGEVTATVKK